MPWLVGIIFHMSRTVFHVRFLRLLAIVLPIVEVVVGVASRVITLSFLIGNAPCTCAFASHIFPKSARWASVPIGVLICSFPPVPLKVCCHISSNGHQLREGASSGTLVGCHCIPNLVIVKAIYVAIYYGIFFHLSFNH